MPPDNCDVACQKGDFAYDGNFELNIYFVRALSVLQNNTLFIEIDQCNQVLYLRLENLIVFFVFAACFAYFLEKTKYIFSPHILFLLHILKELSYTNLTSIGLLQKQNRFDKIGRSVHFLNFYVRT